jgi:Mn-dependent DtxR family transcriptional regulator
MDFLRASGVDPEIVPAHLLPTRQRVVLEAIHEYTAVTGEPCPGRYLARRLNLHLTTVQDHLITLHRKGWLRSPNAPAFLRRTLR